MSVPSQLYAACVWEHTEQHLWRNGYTQGSWSLYVKGKVTSRPRITYCIRLCCVYVVFNISIFSAFNAVAPAYWILMVQCFRWSPWHPLLLQQLEHWPDGSLLNTGTAASFSQLGGCWEIFRNGCRFCRLFAWQLIWSLYVNSFN